MASRVTVKRLKEELKRRRLPIYGDKSDALRGPDHAPWLARRSMARRATRMTCHAPVRTGGAVGAGWDLD